MPYRQGLHDLLTLLTGQWTVAVISTLAVGERTFSDLLAKVNETEDQQGWITHKRPLSPRTLTDTLRRLEANKLVDRRTEDKQVKGSWAWYKLTADGRELLSMLRPLAKFAGNRRAGTS
ncbi:hypothetical protein GCM10022222_86180 [Amycolatopsis ultiminotia]|uniref:HTH hxlR-type domain-containing protein n=1 Tax=Amycolatopsis ultiminotia TaxID=543629 RepID=A0ABP6YRH5_9PSEU